jgi:putative ABC transport system permease protein
METALRNLQLSFRQIRRHPGLAAAVLLTLGLAIGANTAVFSFVNALLLHPFPFRDSAQLVEIYSLRGGQPGRISMREMLDIQEQVSVLDGIAGRTAGFGGYNFSGEGKPQEWKTVLITGNIFDVLGVPLAIGNIWPEAADRIRYDRVILSHRVWQSSFAGARSVVGRNIVLDHSAGYYVDGVAQNLFDYPRGIEIYRSLGGFTGGDKRDSRNLIAVARIKRPFSISRLQQELEAVSNRLARQFPNTNAGLGFRAESFRDIYSGDVRPYLLVMFGAVAFVLLIACVNVVNLLLSRALARDREIAVRTSLGASRWNLIAQLLTESTVLSISAASFGLVLAYWLVKALRAMIGLELPSWMVIEIDLPVLTFTAGMALIAGIASGLAPALHASRTSSAEALKAGGRGGTKTRSAGRLRNLLIVSEVALTLVLLAGAGLLIRSFSQMQQRDRGFRSESIATARVFLGWKRYIDQETVARYYDRAIDLLSAVPGVKEVAVAPNPPLTRQEEASPNTVQAEGQPVADAMRNPYVTHQSISEGYFSLMQIALKSGRFFTRFDRVGSEPVAIVNERLASRLWPGRDPIGEKLRYDPRDKAVYRKVVGVVANVQQTPFADEAGYDYYVPYRQEVEWNEFILAKTDLPLPVFSSKLEQALWSVDSEQSVFDFKSYDDRVLDSIWQLRCRARCWSFSPGWLWSWPGSESTE